jgi:hypothetical protein
MTTPSRRATSKRKRRSGARTVIGLVITMIFGLALVFFPMKNGRGAPGDGADAATKPAANPKPAGKRGPNKDDGGAGDGGVQAPAPTTPTPAAAAAAAAADGGAVDPEAKALPTGKGLPVLVNVGVFFLELKSFDDNKAEFECTTDLRLRWTGLRLRYPASEVFRGYKEYRGKDAEEQLGKMWSPNIDVTNKGEAQAYVGRRLRVFPDGGIETLTRTTAKYKVRVDAERFPFDQQKLVIEMLVREDTTDEVVLRFDKTDVEFSHVARGATLEGWQPGLVDLRGTRVPGWNGDRYSKVTASLSVQRLATTSLAPIFIPLVASLLIPLLAIWMNKATEDGFEIEAFELANMGIGGLFSVIALSFAIYSAYGVVAGGDNTVTRLFGLNYVSLALSLSIVVFFFRYNVLLRWFGTHVQEQAFNFLTWALPLLSLATSLAFLLVAAA